jgi:Zn-dependent membrane protease YugP
MPFLYFDPMYFMFMIPGIILSVIAQVYVSSAYNRWSQEANGSRLSGPEVARRIMRHAGLDVGLETTPQEMGDHYDPQSHTVRMSPGVARTNSVASMAIVAHELGHAQQHQEGSMLITARNFLLPAVQISPMISYGLIMIGLLFNLAGLAQLGIIFFGVTVLFMLLTLPVEIDASMRGLRLLNETGLMMYDSDRSGARSVLTAAALTYVAAAVTSVLQLLYFVSLVNRRD